MLTRGAKMKKVLYVSFILIVFLFSSCDLTIRDNVDTIKSTPNSLNITIDIPEGEIDKIVVSSVMKNEMDLPVHTAEKTYDNYAGGDITYDVGYYGKHEITIKTYKGNSLVDTILKDYIVTADNYNIALLAATMPVTYTSLMLADAGNTTNPINAIYPTIVTLERADAYNWDTLLPDMTDCPFIDGYKTGNNGAWWGYFISAYKSYVSYLHGLDPSSRFHFIFNDSDASLIPLIAFEAGLTTDEFSTTLISDGTKTYVTFKNAFGNGGENDTSLDKYSELESIWNNVKLKAQAGDSTYMDDLKDHAGLFPWLSRYMEDFVPILINDPDLEIKWVINRNNADVFGNSKIYLEKVESNANVLAIGMKDLLNTLTEEEKGAFKNLYDLSLEAFDEADKENKQIMIFLGAKNDETKHLDEFLSFFTNYYGHEDYALFYKGHPGDLSNDNKAKAEIIEKYGWQELDAQIPAELFYFFRPDCIMGGYGGTSTFDVGVDISFQVFDGPKSAADITHLDRSEGYVEIDSHGRYHTVKTDGTECYWDPNNPTDFDFK